MLRLKGLHIMTHNKFRLLLPLFVLLLAGLNAHAEGDNKKNTKQSRQAYTAYAMQTEPDALVQKPQKSTKLLSVAEAKSPAAILTGGGREGIDVSRYQGIIDWTAVATEKISYVYIKATEGVSLVDPTYRRNITEARRAGLRVGSYHFYRAHLSLDDQLKNLTTNVLPAEQDLLPMIDVEHTNGVPADKFVKDLRRFVEGVTKFYGKKPVLYTFQNFYNKYLSGEFKDYVWMIAKYRQDEPVLSDNLSYVMWQYTQTGRISGVKGDVDRSVIMEPYSLHDFLY